jgi:hypothetical protein
MSTSERDVEQNCIIRSFRVCPVPCITRAFKSRRVRWVGYEERMGEMKNAYRFKAGKSKWKSSLGRPRHNWKKKYRNVS